jgi:NADH dehydrogenase [ubiquinone] 1 alpha subcomplex assembly factor 1
VLARTLKCPPCKGREITPYVDPESGKDEEEPVMTATRLFLPVALLLMQAVAKPTLRPLVDFAGPEAAQQWQAVNDGVMGGVSDGRFRITPENTLEFFGTLSLENNGGFASVRTKPTDFDIKAGDTIFVQVRGDGRQYVLTLYTKSRRTAFSYRAPLPTTKDEWTEVAVPLEDFIPTSFGNRVQGMGPVVPDEVTSIGFMLSDKNPGRFKMQVESLSVLRTEN